jgi:YD repeat-containing protein
MIDKLILIGLVFALLVGCKKNDGDGTPDPQEGGCFIMSETINGKPYRTYEYDADQNLFRIVQYETNTSNRIEKRFSFDYDQNDRVVAFRETSLLAPFHNYQYILHYNQEGRADTIRKSEIFNSGPKLLESYALEYDDQHRLTKYKWADNYWRYEYDEANNVTKWLAKYPSIAPIEGILADFGNYDGKHNTYAFSKPAQLINLVGGGGASPQNPGSFKFYEASLTPTQTGVITYQYNERDLPTEASVSIFSAGGGSSTQVYKFAYECL